MGHGGNIYEVTRSKEIALDRIIDFSANINPLGVPNSLKRLITQSVDKLDHYPDIHYHDLKRAIAHYYDIAESYIVVGNGAAQVIFDFIRTLSPRNAVVLAPTFSEYERALSAFDCKIKHFALREEDGFELCKETLFAFIASDPTIDFITLCNPNNPTSTCISVKDLESIIQYCFERQIHMMIDEAFIEFVGPAKENSILHLCKKYSNLLVIRAFTKFYGIPGLRLGFGVCSDETMVNTIKKTTVPWSINTFASAFGQVLMEEDRYVEKTYRWLQAERPRFVEKLREMKGLKVYNPRANFVLLQLCETTMDVLALQERLLQYQILIRNCSNFTGLNEQFFRVAIKGKEDNDKLIGALQKILQSAQNKNT